MGKETMTTQNDRKMNHKHIFSWWILGVLCLVLALYKKNIDVGILSFSQLLVCNILLYINETKLK